MKKLQQFLSVSALTLTLSLPVFAGQIETTVTAPAPSQPKAAAPGEIPNGLTYTGEVTSQTVTVDLVTASALNLLQSVLPLF